MERRVINFLSTMHIGESLDTIIVSRQTLTGTWEDVECPHLVFPTRHIIIMRGIDRGDQFIGYNNIEVSKVVEAGICISN